MKIINFEKKKMIPLTSKEHESYFNKTVTFSKKLEDKNTTDKSYCKVRGHCHYTGKYRIAAHTICNLRNEYRRKCL